MATDVSAIDNATNLAEFTQAVNTATGNVFTMFLLGSIFVFGLLSLRRYGWDKAFTVSSFITSLIGILFLYMEMITFSFVRYIIVAFIISLIFTIWNLRS